MKIKFELKPCGKNTELLCVSTETASVCITQGCTLDNLEGALKILKRMEHYNRFNND
jgi:hypothetical protein